jgi:hypothetical protein
MDLNSRRKLLITGGLTVGALLGGYGIASAQSGSTSPTAPASSQSGETDSPTVKSSITAPNGPDQAGGENDAAESAALAKLAKITPAQAQAAALAAHPGTAEKVELENDNGSLVYAVAVRTSTGLLDVKVDAGNAAVLAVETDNEAGGAEGKGAKDAETNDAPEAPATGPTPNAPSSSTSTTK